MNDIFEPLKARLRTEEGVKQYPYLDTEGKLTIGVGHNLTDRGLSKTIVENLLDEDISIAITDVRFIFSDFLEWSENRQIAILDLMFAMGRPTFLKFEKMIKALRFQIWEAAANELLDSVWASKTGDRAKGLAALIRQG